ncbi:Glutamate receptor ionotropic, delta-1 [Pseudolycoriella hygida]|uniref:Glutamate receptor ionotropic, delta-1 n=1 Tax=Pseudolycoriella hygida TaxID=35572 RepID=A0A9Q0S4J7_9DIPT|nr:Glutamate receptor ionotropic, delta-1 [Pseudolycoriella hygida]
MFIKEKLCCKLSEKKAVSCIQRRNLREIPPTYVLTIVSSFKGNDFLTDLFEASYETSILGINFLLPYRNQSAWLMTTFMPFVNSCSRLQRHDIAVLNNKNYSLEAPLHLIYPKKLEDFAQCPIVVAVFHTPPFVIIESNSTGVTFDGMDTRILQHLAAKFNFKLIYRMPIDKTGRGTIYKNGTITGCIKMVVDREANLTTGAYMTTPERSHYMMASETYIQVSLGFAILPGFDIFTSLERLLAPFMRQVWVMLALCIIFAVFIILTTKKLTNRRRHYVIGGHSNRSPILNMFNSFLGGGIGNPRFSNAQYLSTPARMLLMTWILVCLVLRGSYQGALYDFLQRQALSSPYGTISKINKSDCNLIIMSTATQSLDKFHFPRSRHLVYNYSQQTVFRQVYDDELSGAVYCNDLQLKYFNLLNSPSRVLQMTKDRLFLMSVVIYFNNVSILQPIFDEEIKAFTDAGLIGYWTREFIDERIHSKNYDQRVPKELKLQHLTAIFKICAGLLLCCLFVFLLEKFGIQFTLLKNVIEDVTY